MAAKDTRDKSKGGRPTKELDERQIFELAKIHCTYREISSVMGCSVATLERRYDEIIKNGYETGKTKLRRLQWSAAERGNPQILIHLGKHILKQTDEQLITQHTTLETKVDDAKLDTILEAIKFARADNPNKETVEQGLVPILQTGAGLQ